MENNKKRSPVSVYALGGLGEVGKNTYCIENDTTLIIIDAGVKFSSADMPGVNYIIPDYTHLKENQKKVKALFITHGHEDHIGGIPFLLQQMQIPVIYAPKLALALIQHKLSEMKVKPTTRLVEYDGNSLIKVDDLEVSFYHVTHSIPDSYGIKVNTPEGTIVHSGDFKIDLTPVDDDFDLTKLAKIGSQGVDLLLADSTNAEQEGYTQSEKTVISSINEIFKTSPGRLIISTFSSNISRIQQIVEAACANHRKIAIFGRSMESNFIAAREFGYIKISDSSIISGDQIRNTPASELLILCTGSQGEPLAALSRIANGQHRQIKIQGGDTVVFSSSPIPGNTASINKVVNKLTRCGANVITNSVLNHIHTSGHPCKQELRLIQKLVKPHFFMPIHGEYHMLKLHADIAVECGLAREKCFIMDIGDTIVLSNHKVTRGEHVQADSVYLDGQDAIGLSNAVLKDRKIMAENGMIYVTAIIDKSKNTLAATPIIKTNGFSYLTTENSNIIIQCRDRIIAEMNKTLKSPYYEKDLENVIKFTTGEFFSKVIHRNPLVIPVIMNIGE